MLSLNVRRQRLRRGGQRRVDFGHVLEQRGLPCVHPRFVRGHRRPRQGELSSSGLLLHRRCFVGGAAGVPCAAAACSHRFAHPLPCVCLFCLTAQATCNSIAGVGALHQVTLVIGGLSSTASTPTVSYIGALASFFPSAFAPVAVLSLTQDLASVDVRVRSSCGVERGVCRHDEHSGRADLQPHGNELRTHVGPHRWCAHVPNSLQFPIDSCFAHFVLLLLTAVEYNVSPYSATPYAAGSCSVSSNSVEGTAKTMQTLKLMI